MKIEIGESLVYSFLRHEKQCLVAQTNWKSSNNWQVSKSAKTGAKQAFERINQHSEFKGIFKSGFKQTLKQAEIDVLGIDAKQNVYAFEVAFHENGLQYGKKIATRDRVFKKLLRAYIVLKYYFPKHHHVIAFCSPKINPATEKHIKEYFKILKKGFQSDEVTFEYYANAKFTTEIVKKVIERTTDEADSSELFARAVKLLHISSKFQTQQVRTVNNDQTNTTKIDTNTKPIDVNGISIPTHPIDEIFQNYIKRIMHLLFDNSLLTEDEILNLQNTEYCKNTFNLQFPMLVKTDGNFDRRRYWVTVTFNNNQFYVCSQWWPDHFPKYQECIINWLNSLQAHNH